MGDDAVTQKDLEHTQQAINVLREDFRTHVGRNDETLDKIWNKLDEVQTQIWKGFDNIQKQVMNRLPLWATFLITGLFSAVTGLAVWALGARK